MLAIDLSTACGYAVNKILELEFDEQSLSPMILQLLTRLLKRSRKAARPGAKVPIARKTRSRSPKTPFA